MTKKIKLNGQIKINLAILVNDDYRSKSEKAYGRGTNPTAW